MNDVGLEMRWQVVGHEIQERPCVCGMSGQTGVLKNDYIEQKSTHMVYSLVFTPYGYLIITE